MIIAVSYEEGKKWGCPYCGYRYRFSSRHGFGPGMLMIGCESCKILYLLYTNGMEQPKNISFGGERPVVREHPRRGIPPHANSIGQQ